MSPRELPNPSVGTGIYSTTKQGLIECPFQARIFPSKINEFPFLQEMKASEMHCIPKKL